MTLVLCLYCVIQSELRVETDLEVTQFRERVDDDAKDDVESDGSDEDEERYVEQHEETELDERVVGRMTH